MKSKRGPFFPMGREVVHVDPDLIVKSTEEDMVVAVVVVNLMSNDELSSFVGKKIHKTN